MKKTATVTTVLPLNGRVTIEVTEKEPQTGTGILIPETARETERLQTGTVISADEYLYIDGMKQRSVLQPGVIVIFERHSGSEFKLNDKKILILKQSEIVGVLV